MLPNKIKNQTDNIYEFFRKKPYAFWLVLFIILPLSYYIIEWLDLDAHLIYSRLDGLIPFSEYFVLPYLLWFPLLFFTNLYLLLRDKRDFLRAFALQIVGFSVGVIIQAVYPTTFTRHTEFTNNNIFTLAVKFIYWIDKPVNVLPSMHVYMALACCAGLFLASKSQVPKWALILSPVLAVAISASTVLIKQHSILDVFAALIEFAILFPLVLICFRLRDKHSEITNADQAL